MHQPTDETTNTCEPPRPPVGFHGLRLEVPPGTESMAWLEAGNVRLTIGPPIVPDVQLGFASAHDAHQFLTDALKSLEIVAPCLVQGPDSRVVEARDTMVDDVLRLLGKPRNAIEIPIDELGISDIRAARRLAQRVVDVLDESIDATSKPASVRARQAVR